MQLVGAAPVHSAPPPGKVVSAQTKGELEVPEAVGGGWICGEGQSVVGIR